MLLVISPAKSLELEKKIPFADTTQHFFQKETQELMGLLKKLKAKDLSSLMDISPALSLLNFDRNQQFANPFPPDLSRPCIFTFDGEVYNGLDAFTMKKKDVLFAQKHLRMLSGLYGVLKPLDMMMPYRLEMGTSLKNKKGKNLYAFWGEKITDFINEEMKNMDTDILLNLASSEYFQAIHPKKIKGKIIEIQFKEKKGNDYKMIGFTAKKARGLMSRFIIDHQLNKVEDLKAFNIENYAYHVTLSNEDKMVFVR